MSTHRPPEQAAADGTITIPTRRVPEVFWAITWENGGSLDNGDGRTWESIAAHPERIDGLTLSLTPQRVQRLTLIHGVLDAMEIVPPEPLPCFGFARYAQAVGGEAAAHPTWLYSAFGYVLPDYVFVAKMRNGQSPECLLLPRPMTFPL